MHCRLHPAVLHEQQTEHSLARVYQRDEVLAPRPRNFEKVGNENCAALRNASDNGSELSAEPNANNVCAECGSSKTCQARVKLAHSDTSCDSFPRRIIVIKAVHFFQVNALFVRLSVLRKLQVQILLDAELRNEALYALWMFGKVRIQRFLRSIWPTRFRIREAPNILHSKLKSIEVLDFTIADT